MVEKKRFKDFLEEHHRLPTRDRLKQLMEPDSYEDLLVAIADVNISTGTILRALQSMGFEVTKSSIFRWRQSVKIQ